MKFYNAVLEIGVKRTQNTFEDFTTYFGVGARAELTTNQKFEFNTEYIEWVRKFNYGLSFLGGIEYSLGKQFEMVGNCALLPIFLNKFLFLLVHCGTIHSQEPHIEVAKFLLEISLLN